MSASTRKGTGLKFVNHEIKRSHQLGKGMLGIHIHGMKDKDGNTDSKGIDPFTRWHTTRDGKKIYFSELYKTYDWISDDGRKNLGGWIEAAATAAGK